MRLGAGLQSNRGAVYTVNKLNWFAIDTDCFHSELVFVLFHNENEAFNRHTLSLNKQLNILLRNILNMSLYSRQAVDWVSDMILLFHKILTKPCTPIDIHICHM